MTNTFFWFRRDLRLTDNAGLYYALKENSSVQPVFIFDQNILDKLQNKRDARVGFIHSVIKELKEELSNMGSDLQVYYGNPIDIWKNLLAQTNSPRVYCNRDYEPYALNRDTEVKNILEANGGQFFDYKDHVIFEKDEVVKSDGLPYTVFTPYKRKWLSTLDGKNHYSDSYFLSAYPTNQYFANFVKKYPTQLVKLAEMGFLASDIEIPPTEVAQSIIKSYDTNRDFPAIEGTSKLGIHFRFGTISIREKARKASQLNETFLSELVWRDFYSQILYHFPHVEKAAFRAKYELVQWRDNIEDFDKWCNGMTGYPIVDAGMRELNISGWMHNRVRMITASFLTKHLLIDWRLGEQYFADKLLDYDLASNNGGWQWAAGCGTDAAPYFRIFNPHTQLDKFDKQRVYVNKYVEEYGTDAYPTYMVDHKMARERCLNTYKIALDSVKG